MALPKQQRKANSPPTEKPVGGRKANQMVISRYSVTADTKSHGRIIFKTVATSPKTARKNVLDAESMPARCIVRTRKLKQLHPR